MSDITAPDYGSLDAIVKKAYGHMTETEAMANNESRRTQRAIVKDIATDKPPPAPDTPPPPQPIPPQQQRSPMEMFGSAASVLGILGGLLSRAPLTASLKAATGAMNGYRQRDLETYQQNLAQWKAQSEYAEQLAEWQQNRYKAAYDQYKDRHDELMGAWRMLATQDQNDYARKAAETGDMRVIEEAIRINNEALSQFRNWKLQSEKLSETRTAELQATDELKRTSAWEKAPPEKRVQMLEELHGAFQKDATLFGGSISNPAMDTTNQPHGTEFLKTLKPEVATTVKALAEGRMPFPSGFALRSPYWQQLLQAVSQYDPSFDAVNYNARARTRNDFTSGAAAKNITSFNTVMGHFDSLAKAWEKLDNGDYPAVNALSNSVIQQRGDPRVASFNLARNAVAEELERAFRGTGGNVMEIESWKAGLDAAASPDQQRAVIEQGLSLLKSRIDAVGDQYNRGMGLTSDPLDLLNPTAKAAYQRLSKTKPSKQDIAEPKTQQEYDALPSGALFKDDEGVKRKP